ncbi:GTPase Era [candidate division WOR-3 bacterium]|nr:GTPase Era [candidate division WOR-3 bacterium]
MKKSFKSGYVGIFGLPNAGKSTLLNKIIDFDLSPVSKKPQMTRNRILGILNDSRYQIVFVDTPGFLDPKYKLQKHMSEEISKAARDCDAGIYVTDPVMPSQKDISTADSIAVPLILCVNKIDKLKNKGLLLPVIDEWRKTKEFAEIILISALRGDNTEKVVPSVLELLKPGPRYFDEDALTDRTDRFYSAEIIRESCYDLFRKEVPYSISVVVEDFKERYGGKKHYIKAVLYVERESQKAIVIGRNGQMIKKLGALSREKMKKYLERDVFLDLSVKLMKNWKDDSGKISRLGLNN